MISQLVAPMIALIILTFFVWCLMYYRRLSYVLKNKIHANKLETPEQCQSVLPEYVNKPSNNFKNLFEVPVVFYVLSSIAIITNSADNTIIYLAWAFVFARIIHSIFHCYSKSVMARFYMYLLSSIILWLMLAKVIMTLFL